MNCKNCNYWKPAYKGVGECGREGRHNATFWVDGTPGASKLLTLAEFGCKEYQPVPAIETETL